MRRPWLLPLVGFALALALRSIGIGFFLPHQSDPDDHAIDQLLMMQTGEPDYVFSWGKYGHLVPRVMILLPDTAVEAPLDSTHEGEHLAAASRNHLRARWISALLGAAAVPGTYWLAAAWLPPGWSLVAGLFAGTSLLHVSFSQQARPHVPFTTLALFAVLAAMRLRRAPTKASLALYCGALFLTVGTLHSAVFAAFSGFVALLLARGREGRPRFLALAAAWQTLVALASLALFWPFLFAREETFELFGQTIDPRFPHKLDTRSFDGSGFGVWLDTLAGYDPALLWAAALGLAGALLRLPRLRSHPLEARRDLAVALAFAVPCALAFGLFARSFERFFLPLYPYLGLLAALGLHDVTRAIARVLPSARTGLAVGLSVLALALPAYASTRLVWLRSRPDTFELAARHLAGSDGWPRERVLLHPRAFLPAGSRLDPGYREAKGSVPFPSAWLRYIERITEAGGDAAGAELVPFPQALRRHAAAPSPAAVEVLGSALEQLAPSAALSILPYGPGRIDALTLALERRFERVWEIPHEEGEEHTLSGYAEPRMLRVVLASRVWGPRLALYRPRS